MCFPSPVPLHQSKAKLKGLMKRDCRTIFAHFLKALTAFNNCSHVPLVQMAFIQKLNIHLSLNYVHLLNTNMFIYFIFIRSSYCHKCVENCTTNICIFALGFVLQAKYSMSKNLFHCFFGQKNQGSMIFGNGVQCDSIFQLAIITYTQKIKCCQCLYALRFIANQGNRLGAVYPSTGKKTVNFIISISVVRTEVLLVNVCCLDIKKTHYPYHLNTV